MRNAWLMLLPSLLLLAAVAGWPLLRTLEAALTDAHLGTFSQSHWVGLQNFIDALGDPDWWHAARNTVVFAIASVGLEFCLGLVIALTLNVRFPGCGTMRALVLVPWVVPTVVAGQMWRWMYNDSYGVVNAMLQKIGIIDSPVAWLADDRTALLAVVLTDVWKATPFVALLLLAGLQTIPLALYEAARIDGAGPIQRFWYVTLPLLRPAISVTLIFRTLDALRIFDLIYVMTSNSRATQSVSVYARQQLVDFQSVGFGSAVSMLIFLMVALASVLYLSILRPEFASRP